MNARRKKGKAKTKEEIAGEASNKVDEVQKYGAEVKEILEQIGTCDLENVIHAAKIARYGEVHTRMAQSYIARAKGEVEKAKRENNSKGTDGGKQLARAIGDPAGKSLTCVCRDQDTNDGGNKRPDD